MDSIQYMNKQDLAEWKMRRNLLIHLQEKLTRAFPAEDYNVFIFGSFIREDFIDGESDIDVIVYCENQERQSDIAVFIKKFFDHHNMQSDILQYFFSLNAPIYASILGAVRLTDYFPKRLKNELYYLVKAYKYDSKKKLEKQRYLHWYYLMNQRKLKKEEGK